MTELIKLTKRTVQIFALFVIDVLAFYVSLFIAWALRAELMSVFLPELPVFSYSYFFSFWWMPVIYIFFISYESLYSNNLPFWDETLEMVKSLSLASVAIMVMVTLGKIGEMVSRLVLLGLWAVSLFVFPIFRLWGKKILYSLGIWKENVLILGAGNSGRLVMEGLQREKHMGYDVVGFLDDDADKRGKTLNGKKVFGSVRYFPKFIKELGIKTVIIAMPSLSTEKLSLLTARVQNHANNTMVIPDIKGIALLNTALFHLFYEEIFMMNIRNNLKSGTNRFIKRFFEISASIIFLPLLLPLVGIIALAVKLETPGPAIYAHERIGRNGGFFRCYKFRTMKKDAEESLKELLGNSDELRNEWERNWKLKDDPRITRIGRFLRRTSLDELPQIFNVLMGNMSLVGPRPYLPREKKHIEKDMQVICSAKPGITGLWQVSGRSGTDYERRVRLDAWYVMNWSLWLDIVILFRTIRVVTKMEGAY